MKSVCLAILNYNGIHHLEHLLPTVETVVVSYPGVCRAIVLDNCSNQNDKEWIHLYYPNIEVISAPSNNYLFSYNWLLPQLTEEIVILLNNDLRLSPNFLNPLLEHFCHEDVFAVSATSMDWGGQFFTCGFVELINHHGWYSWSYKTQQQELSHTLFASGGFSAVDRKKFLELGGFNHLFHPAYGEDLDLCFRAWRRGWRSIFEPKSVVYHRESGSWNATKADNTALKLISRAQLLFIWFTLPPGAPTIERYAMYFYLICFKLSNKQSWYLKVWLDAIYTRFKLQQRYLWMKMTQDELETILEGIRKPVLTNADRNSLTDLQPSKTG
jgi:GT2 family glycosyltransferase